MASFNRWDGIGHMGDKAHTGTSADGVFYARFSLAVQQRRPKLGAEKPPLWMDCVAFGRAAEIIEQYTAKGAALHVSGSLQEKQPYTRRDGATVQAYECIVKEFTLIDPRREAASVEHDEWDE